MFEGNNIIEILVMENSGKLYHNNQLNTVEALIRMFRLTIAMQQV